MENLGPLISMVEFLLDFVLFICINVFSTLRSGFMLLLHVNLDGWCNPYPPNLTWSLRDEEWHPFWACKWHQFPRKVCHSLYSNFIPWSHMQWNNLLCSLYCTQLYSCIFTCIQYRWKKIALFGHLDSQSCVVKQQAECMSPHGDEIPRIGEESKRVGVRISGYLHSSCSRTWKCCNCTEHLYKNDNDEKPEKIAYSCVFCNGRIEIWCSMQKKSYWCC